MSDGERTWDEMWMLPCGDAARPDHPAFWAEVVSDREDGPREACEHCRLRHRGCRFGIEPGAPPPRFVRTGSDGDAEARVAESVVREILRNVRTAFDGCSRDDHVREMVILHELAAGGGDLKATVTLMAAVMRAAVEETEAEKDGIGERLAHEEREMRAGKMAGRLYWASRRRREAVAELRKET